MQSTEKFHRRQEGFPKRLQWARERLGFSVLQFARAAGYNRTYIYKLEHGQAANPSSEFFDKMSEKFGIRREWLLEGDGGPFVSQETERLMSEKHVPIRPVSAAEPSAIPVLLSTFTVEELNDVVAFFLNDVNARPVHIQKLSMEIAHQAFNEIRSRLKNQGQPARDLPVGDIRDLEPWEAAGLTDKPPKRSKK
jgi:transcriptional regulator with XRE-family HTH domain